MNHPRGEWEEPYNPDGALADDTFPSTATSLCKDTVSKIIVFALRHVTECKHHPGRMVSTHTFGFSMAFPH